MPAWPPPLTAADVGQAAGPGSPHLDKHEQDQAAEHAAPQALVIHEVVREEGENELRRAPGAVAWSGFAAGLSMGFSFLMLAVAESLTPHTPWARLVYAGGYTVGFVITILGRQELYTESTLTAMLPLLVHRDLRTLFLLLRFWAVVLAANLFGTALFALLLSIHGLFSEDISATLAQVGSEAVSGAFLPTFVRAVLAGWLIALMAWMLPSARTARLFVILLITYVVALASLSHIVAGSVEAAYAVFNAGASWRDYALGFFLPTFTGNTLGGVALVALLNHAPVRSELQGGDGGERTEEARGEPRKARPRAEAGAPATRRSRREEAASG